MQLPSQSSQRSQPDQPLPEVGSAAELALLPGAKSTGAPPAGVHASMTAYTAAQDDLKGVLGSQRANSPCSTVSQSTADTCICCVVVNTQLCSVRRAVCIEKPDNMLL